GRRSIAPRVPAPRRDPGAGRRRSSRSRLRQGRTPLLIPRGVHPLPPEVRGGDARAPIDPLLPRTLGPPPRHSFTRGCSSLSSEMSLSGAAWAEASAGAGRVSEGFVLSFGWRVARAPKAIPL